MANLSFVVMSNFISLFISSITILFIPKVIGIEEYGYWQLYTFYIGYVGFFHLGWPDGIYLKFGGKNFHELNKKYFTNQLIAYNLYLFIVSILIILWSQFINIINDKSFIFVMVAINIVLMNLRTFFIWILQSTNKIKEASTITIFDRLVYLFILCIFLLFKIYDYKFMIFIDILGKLVGVFLGIWQCRTILSWKNLEFKPNIREYYDNIRIGINLMLSNVASLLIIGVIRLGIEREWDIATFGKVSLTLSISNLLMLFINAIGIVVFPIIKKSDEQKLPLIYKTIRSNLMIFMFLILMGYYPLRIILNNWLPAYEESLIYMVIIFPMAIFEGKMALLINTYMKALRMERLIFRVNIVVLLISVLSTILTAAVLHNLELTIASIVVLLGLRSIIAEHILSKRLSIEVKGDTLIEVLLTFTFIISGWYLSIPYALTTYLITYIIYISLNWKSCKFILSFMKNSNTGKTDG